MFCCIPGAKIKDISFLQNQQLKEDIVKKFSAPKQIILTDNNYGLITLDSLNDFLDQDYTNFRKYYSEKYDCDNFALSLMARQHEWFSKNCGEKCGSAFGIVHGRFKKIDSLQLGGYHACNFAAIWHPKESEVKIVCIEPQTDDVFDISPDSQIEFVYC